MLHAVIMAGGRGTRFWPWSRRSLPKQFLPIADSRSMLRATVDRLLPLLPKEQVFIATSRDLAPDVLDLIPELPQENIIIEPAPRDTAPCVGLATIEVMRRDPEAVLAILPSDHVIKKGDNFRKILWAAYQGAKDSNAIITLGLLPSRPETGYGYIHKGSEIHSIDNFQIFEVHGFAEKPNKETARRFVDSHCYLWNGGMFIFRGTTMIKALEKHMPELALGLKKINDVSIIDKRIEIIDEVFPGLPKISIDFGLMEHYSPIWSIEADIGWSDVGSFDEVGISDDSKDLFKNESLVSYQSQRNILIGSERVVALVGCEDLIVVDTLDALLICRRGHGQGVKEIVKQIELKGRNDLL